MEVRKAPPPQDRIYITLYIMNVTLTQMLSFPLSHLFLSLSLSLFSSYFISHFSSPSFSLSLSPSAQHTRSISICFFPYSLLPTLSRRQLPHSPENPMATLSPSEKRSINLTWAQAFDGNSPLIRYILEVSENSEWIN